MSGHFEAKKHAYRQTQDGIVISFVCHPNDVDAELAIAPLGTRYMIGFAELGDDDKPKLQNSSAVEHSPVKREVSGSIPDSAAKRQFKDLKLSNQAGIRCSDPQFWDFLAESRSEDLSIGETSADFTRRICGVSSRSELDTNDIAAAKWRKL